ncbi:aldo/keto reductase, partial [Bilophila wadsworthia]|uniref:aldo/keto reductase n=1 Tax=Bilophila wadsworthia TaxID=35833 RepID=UPI003AB539D9
MSIRDIAEPVSLNDGTVMPGYGFGGYAAHGEEIINAIRWAVRDGYRYIDSAAMYGNEAEVGEAIRTCGVQREELFISSKIWPTRFDDPDASLAQSLRDLGIDALDCCLLHWPGTDRKQRLSAYEKLLRRREEGFVRRIGVSNFQIKHLEEIRSAFGSFPVLNQIELHPLY